ncbi:putative fluoride ion transporter CrcB [compost metagenome]
MNMIGSFAAGFLAIWLEGRGPSALYWRAFLLVGVLGALTTYSALMVECLLFARTERQGMVLGYLAFTLLTGLLLVWLGARLADTVRAPVW